MKMREPTKVTIGDYNFYIHPFGAMKSANISGELVGFISPIIGALVALVGGDTADMDSVFDMNIEDAAPVIIKAFSTINGETVEKLLTTLIIANKNIAFDTDEDQKVEWLDKFNVDDLFVGDIQNMYLLAWEVIKVNYKGFFSKISDLFGSQGNLREAIKNLATTETLTPEDSAQ